MGARGRKTADELEALRLVKAKPLEPPKPLGIEARRIWRETLAALPNDFFTPIDKPILSAYCEACVLRQQAAALLAAEGVLIGEGEARAVHPAVRVHAAMCGSIVSLAGKLHLCHSSRLTRDVANTQATRPNTARRPWNLK